MSIIKSRQYICGQLPAIKMAGLQETASPVLTSLSQSERRKTGYVSVECQSSYPGVLLQLQALQFLS